ncbi:hypothetical protein Fot_11539 [Forsythia ovata]|uniref:Uncharacterized protein n=1 Tax=Forsythia ovata TaxID=205694 RepID=A0ABD1WK04_9LAMI
MPLPPPPECRVATGNCHCHCPGPRTKYQEYKVSGQSSCRECAKIHTLRVQNGTALQCRVRYFAGWSQYSNNRQKSPLQHNPFVPSGRGMLTKLNWRGSRRRALSPWCKKDMRSNFGS